MKGQHGNPRGAALTVGRLCAELAGSGHPVWPRFDVDSQAKRVARHLRRACSQRRIR